MSGRGAVPGFTTSSVSAHCYFLQMALPTLPSCWSSQRHLDLRQRQHQQEDQLRQQWEQNSRYFRTWDIHNSKQIQWSSKISYQRRQVSMCCPAHCFLPRLGNVA